MGDSVVAKNKRNARLLCRGILSVVLTSGIVACQDLPTQSTTEKPTKVVSQKKKKQKPRRARREKFSTNDTYNVQMSEPEGLTRVAGVDCEKPINRVWPRFTIHIPNHYKTGTKMVIPKSVVAEILDANGKVLRSHTMLSGQKSVGIQVKDLMRKQPLSLRLTQLFTWSHGGRKHPIQNRVFQSGIDRENFCIRLPAYKTVKADIKLSPRFRSHLEKENLNLARGYIEVKSQLGELSVDLKVRYDQKRFISSGQTGTPNIWKTEILTKAGGGMVSFTPNPFDTVKKKYRKQDGVTVKVKKGQKLIKVLIK